MPRGLMIEELQHALDSLFGKYNDLNPGNLVDNDLIHAICANEIIENAFFWKLSPAEIEALIESAKQLMSTYKHNISKNR